MTNDAAGNAAAVQPAPTEPAPTAPPVTEPPATEPPPTTSDLQLFPFSGRGDDVIDLDLGPGGWVADIEYKSDSNFVVKTAEDLLVNTIGAYAGRVLIPDGEAAQHFEVIASGPWTINVWSLNVIASMGGSVSGQGDDVFAVSAGVLSAEHSGSSNFVVRCYDNDGRDLLINEIGPYSGRVMGCEGVIELMADGPWTLSVVR